MTGLIADAGDDFSKTLFEGVLCFSLKFKQDINMPWTGSRLLSFDLGNSRYPLFRFCYDYICMQQLNTDLLLETKEELEKLRQYDRYKSINDPDLQMLYNYQIQPESAICQAVENITKKLKNQYNIAFHEYGKLAVYLIRIHNLIQCDISSAKELLVSNLHNRASEIQEEYLFIGQLDPQKESAMILASQNLDDFDQPNVREMTKPLFSIPPHQFLFNAGSIDRRSYMDMLQLEESEYDLIRYPQRGVCLYKCGNERYLLEVHAPPHKEALFGTAGGR